LLGNGSANTPVIRQWPRKCHMSIAADAHAIEEWLEVVFSVQSVPRRYNEDLEVADVECSP
jgi:hypothetical protein